MRNQKMERWRSGVLRREKNEMPQNINTPIPHYPSILR